MQPPPLGLYIHLPWCARKCPYCDFNSHERDVIPEQAYIEQLLNDLGQDLRHIGERSVETLFIGGGTPSLFSAQSIRQLLLEIDNILPLSADLEATLEANPGSAEAEKFAAFRQAGINRLSLGIQSFHEPSLRELGRIHSADEAHAAIEHARSAGFDNLNLDLMHGLPGQSVEAAIADLDSAIRHAPAHLSWYQLTIEPNTVFHKRPPLLPVEDTLADIQQAGERRLAQAGYTQYEVSAYHRPDNPCRHNLNYWSFGDYLGIGAGAHGKLSLADGRVLRTAKRRQPADYLACAPEQLAAKTRVLGEQDLIGEYMLNALRLNAGFRLRDFSARTGLAAGVLEPQLASLCARELLERDGERVRTTALGRRFLDSVVAEFFPD